MNRRQFLGLTASTGISAGCVGDPTGESSQTGGTSPTTSRTAAGTTPDGEDTEACEREHQYFPDIRVENDDDVTHEVTLTVEKITREEKAVIYENVFDVPKQGERTVDVAFEEPRPATPDAEYLATAEVAPTNSSTGTEYRSSAKVGSTVVYHPLRYGIEIGVNSNGQIRMSEGHVDGAEKTWANTCGDGDQ